MVIDAEKGVASNASVNTDAARVSASAWRERAASAKNATVHVLSTKKVSMVRAVWRVMVSMV